MILAELNVRHTRRHMPTRRVALDPGYLPMSGPAHGAALLAAVVAESVVDLDDEDLEQVPRLLQAADDGLTVPRLALHYRLQTDVHGLDRSRHRVIDEGGRLVLELDVHGAAMPQLLGSVLAAASMGPTTRRLALRAIEAAIAQPGVIPEPFVVRRLLEGVPGARPPLAGQGAFRFAGPGGGGLDDAQWRGVPAERRWAMEVLGITPAAPVVRDDVQRRFRRLLRAAHPDHGGEQAGAAERIAELSEARELLLTHLAERLADTPA